MTPEVLQYAFMQRAVVAAVLVGLAAPAVGVFLVQRRLSLIGDGIGHVALTGVAVGLLTARSPVLTALVAAVAGALAIELVRARGRTSGDIALAVLFYGGIAGGVVIVGLAEGGSTATLNTYLFGAITTTSSQDLVVFAVLAVTVLLVTLVLAGRLFAVSADEEFARASGLPVLGLNVVLAVLTAVTVVVSMRVVGLLLISALMILPVASSQLLRTSFHGTAALAVLIGVLVSVSGVTVSFYANTPSGGTIVLLAIGVFVVAAVLTALGGRWRRRRGREAPGPHPGPLLTTGGATPEE